MKICVIIPAFNEEHSIEKVVRDLPENVDFVVINDCSTDETESILRSSDINHISLPVNLGIGGAVQTGYIYALENNYDIAIQIDGDGQHDSSYIRQLIDPIIAENVDCVIGSRFINNDGFQSTAFRRVGIGILSFFIKVLCGVKITDVTSGFRAINRKGIELFAREYAQDYPEPEAIVRVSKAGMRIKEIPVIMNERQGGASSINGLKSAYYMFKVTIALILARIKK